MKTIKLNAIDSTNSFLKDLAQNSDLENYTVVVTNNQTNGRGQQHQTWHSQPFKNLTFSIFINNLNLDFKNKKYLNFAISLAVFEAVLNKNIKNLAIKWPNDIMAGKKKICGILIETTIKGSKIKNCVIGIGLNVNQINFPKNIKNVSSLKNITEKEFDLDILLNEIVDNFKEKINYLSLLKFDELETNYLNVLYKKNIPTMFKDSNDVLFMGIIRSVSKYGNLLIELEDETLKEFGIKEVSLA
ncbi:biotin--[acetyl-CoA-carboxylase] ligase [uncultured Polaribacter sp.]|uniref:biotin--[acetyl-CoA-carboxylase] ligase n=1 Tax=uncultured Polaribacter sp. TaxID=174711 RepID=UPI00262CF808|nr:biotin--[acetyl-CoA-carboxylase] ligase [uncultured Polaribacter sp.]